MQTFKIVMYVLIIAGLVGVFGGIIVGKVIRKHKSGDYKPVLTKKEMYYSLGSVGLGVLLIIAGIFAPRLFKKSSDSMDQYGEGFEDTTDGFVGDADFDSYEESGGEAVAVPVGRITFPKYL